MKISLINSTNQPGGYLWLQDQSASLLAYLFRKACIPLRSALPATLKSFTIRKYGKNWQDEAGFP